ncbi:MAG: hypothetical protein WKI04_17860 [Ferruginibacter sp.]
MMRLIVMIILFLLSLLTFFRAPTNLLWYVSILVTEFSWVFFVGVVVLLLWHFGETRYNAAYLLIGVVSMALFAIPVIDAYRTASVVKKDVYR